MSATTPSSVRIVEVGPRDGLQNEAKPVATEDKFTFVRLLAEAGVREIELTSFVRPDAIPQLADAAALAERVRAHGFSDAVRLSALVPNMRGLEAALAAGIPEVAVFLATSDRFSERNIRATVEESFTRIAPVIAHALQSGLRVRGYLSTVYGCPYEGKVEPQKVLRLSERLLEMGVYEVSLGDTTGIATPGQVEAVLGLLLAIIPAHRLAGHFHDTRGMALANILTAWKMGITTFDASAGGLGGCPYATGASGNVATEEVVALLESLGAPTGISLPKLVEASAFMLDRLGRESPSKLHRVLASTAAAH